ncbi:MAG: hypothetical protein ACKPFD_06540, partial [Dolichospermum sp.]
MVRYLLRFAVAWGQFSSGLVDLILTIYTNSFWSKPLLNFLVWPIWQVKVSILRSICLADKGYQGINKIQSNKPSRIQVAAAEIWKYRLPSIS